MERRREIERIERSRRNGSGEKGNKHTSVYGLYAGLNLIFSRPIFLKKTRMKPDAEIRYRYYRHATGRLTDEVSEGKVAVGDDTFNLVELG